MTASSLNFRSAAEKLRRALIETRIRGVKTNIPFIRNVLSHALEPGMAALPGRPHPARPALQVLSHPQFISGEATTSFIGDYSDELFDFGEGGANRGQKLLDYLGELVVNGRFVQGASGPVTPRVAPLLPKVPTTPLPKGLKQVIENEGPEGFARAVRQHRGLLLTDTTWRDAHQSLLATVRAGQANSG